MPSYLDIMERLVMRLTRRRFLTTSAAVGASLASGVAWSAGNKNEGAWRDIRNFLFKDQPVLPGDGVVRLEAPSRPPNGGDVSMKIFSSYPQNGEKFISDYYLVVDKNPSPVAAHFTLSPHISADINTRIRVNEYSTVRAIARANDDKLYMSTAFVKASGGCSAPPMGDDTMAKLMMGQTQLTQTKAAGKNAYKFNISITHPNYSGLQKDQITTYFIPPHYIETVEVKNGLDDIIFAVKGDISFSENPSFGFIYAPSAETRILRIKVTDSREKIYETEWPLIQTS